MATNSKKPKVVQPTRLSTSASYKIGGTQYTGNDISRLKPQTKEVHTVSGLENAPRQITKTLENQSGVVNTNAGSFALSETATVQTESYKPSVNTQATVQTAPTPNVNSYKPSVSKPIDSVAQPVRTPAMEPSATPVGTTVPSASVPESPNVVTGSEVKQAVQTSVQAQAERFDSNNAFSIERTEIRSEVARTPRAVDAVKTSSPSMEQGSSYKPGVQTQAPAHPGMAAQPVRTPAMQPSATPVGATVPSAPAPGSANVVTGSEVKQAVQTSVQAQTERFNSNNAFSMERTEIRSEVARTPRAVDAVKTSAPVVEQGSVIKSAMQAQEPVKTGAVAQSVRTPAMQPSVAPISPHAAPSPGIGSPNVVTGSKVERTAQNSVQGQTERFNSNNAFSTERTEYKGQVQRTPRTVDAVKTSSPMTGKRQDVTQPGAGGRNPQNAPGKPGISKNVDGVNIPSRPGTPSPFTVKGASVSGQHEIVRRVGSHVNNTGIVGITGMQNTSKVLPSAVAGIQTPNLMSEVKSVYRPNVPLIGAGKSGSIVLSQNQIADLRINMKHMGLSGNLTTGKIQYGENAARAFTLTGKAREGRALTEIREGKLLMGKFAGRRESTSEFVRSIGSTAKFTIKSEAALALKKLKAKPKRNDLLSGGKLLLGKAEGALLSDDDLGTQSAGGVIAAGMMGSAAFKGAQLASEIGVKNVKRIGNGVYQVTTTAGKTSITVGRTVNTMIQNQVVPFSKESLNILRTQARISGLNNTAIAKTIVNKVEKVKASYHAVISGVKNVGNAAVRGARTVKTAVDTTVRIVHGIATGTLTVNLTKVQLDALRQRVFRGIKTGVVNGVKTAAGYAVRGTAKGLSVAVFRGVPKATRFLRNGSMAAAGVMMGSEDYAVQGVGYAITASNIGIKTSIAGVKATGYTVKTAVKAGKSVYSGVKFIRNNGLRAAWHRARFVAKQKFLELGKSVVSLMISGAKALGMKFALPLIIICAVVMMAVGGVTTPMMAVGSIFGGTFSGSDSNVDHDIREYLTDPATGVPSLATDYKQQLANQMRASATAYDIVRFYSNTGSEDVIEPTLTGITSVFPTDEELVNMLHPIFNAMILMKYDLVPTEAQAADMLEELFNKLFRVTTEVTLEQCGQALDTGEGMVTVHSCGYVHALANCPNPISGYHTRYTCSSCCYYDCPGHKYCNGHWYCRGHKYDTNGDGIKDYTEYCSGCRRYYCDECSYNCPGHEYCPGHYYDEDGDGRRDEVYYCGDCRVKYCNYPGCRTRYCDGCDHICSGYTRCGEHDVISYTLSLDGVYALEAEYFTDPIDMLSNINPRNEDQERQLQTLKDYYEIFQELMSHIAVEYGGGLTMADLSGVNFVNGTRVKNQSVVNLALSQVGQQGGRPYWSYYGFSSRVEWCACFVHWCMRNTPSASSAYPTTANNAYCQTIANNFKAMGQWGDRRYTNLVAGDTIFFDWEGDGHTDHIGIVIGRDDTYVYTVEGNSGDAVKSKKYNLGSSVIYGYGLMNY